MADTKSFNLFDSVDFTTDRVKPGSDLTNNGEQRIPISAFSRGYNTSPEFLGNELGGYSEYDTNFSRSLLENDPYAVERNRSLEQGSAAEWGNALIQAGAEILGGTMEGIGYLTSLGTVLNGIQDGEFETGNILTEWGRGIKESAKEAAPIFVNPDVQGTFAPTSSEWWASNFPSIASTLSLMIPSGLAAKALGSLGKLGKIGVEGETIAQWLGTVNKANELTKLGKSAVGISQAVISRHMESMMEATQSYQELYQEAKSKGLSESEAVKLASNSAAGVYKYNWAMLAQDLPQYLFLNGAFAGAKLNESIAMARKMGTSVAAPIAAKTFGHITNMMGEGAEEAYQFVVQEEGRYQMEKAMFPSRETPFSDRIAEYAKDGNMWTSAFFGALGAGAMQAVGAPMMKALMKHRGIESPEDIALAGVDSMAGMLRKAGEERKNTLGVFGKDHPASKASLSSLASTLFTKAVHTGTEEQLDTLLDAFESSDPEQLAKFGIKPEDIASVDKAEWASIKKDIARNKELYAKNKELYDNKKSSLRVVNKVF